MSRTTLNLTLFLVALLVVATPLAASPILIDVNTQNFQNWTVLMGGVSPFPGIPGFVFGQASAGPHEDSIGISPYVTASTARFNGVWAATFAFDVPVGATNVTLDIDSFEVDDRAVLYLNGVAIAEQWIGPYGEGDVNGKFAYGPLTGTPVAEDLTFRQHGAGWGTFTNPFVSGINEIVIIVNNTRPLVTGGPRTASDLTAPLQGASDQTWAELDATVSYDAVPEPATFSLLAAGFGLLLLGARRKRA